MTYPTNLKYTKEHEWIDLETGQVGITDHAQESLGDIVFVELPKVGAEIAAGKSFGTVESVKATVVPTPFYKRPKPVPAVTAPLS